MTGAVIEQAGPTGGGLPWGEVLGWRSRAGGGGEVAALMALSGAADMVAFAGGFPDPATFPTEALAGLVSGLAGDPLALQYTPTAGLDGTRDWLAGRLEALEGHRPGEAELMITSGGIEGLQLLGQRLLDPGDLVVVEGPSYLGAIMGFLSHRAEVVALPMDADGLDVGAVEDLFEHRRPKVIYTIPDHHNPMGVSLSTERRFALVDLARRHGVLIIEDVAYRELAFDGGRRPSLWAAGPDVVAQLGTFSKTFSPGFRLGWIAAPAPLVAQAVLAKQITDQCTGALGQRLIEAYGRSGALDSLIASSRQLYGRRCQVLLESLDRHLPEGVTFTRPGGGFFTWLTAPDGVDTVALAASALAEGVAFMPGRPFYPDGRGGSEIRVSFSRIAEDDIPDGARRLGDILARALAGAS